MSDYKKKCFGALTGIEKPQLQLNKSVKLQRMKP